MISMCGLKVIFLMAIIAVGMLYIVEFPRQSLRVALLGWALIAAMVVIFNTGYH
jgi:hypothetical protein